MIINNRIICEGTRGKKATMLVHRQFKDAILSRLDSPLVRKARCDQRRISEGSRRLSNANLHTDRTARCTTRRPVLIAGILCHRAPFHRMFNEIDHKQQWSEAEIRSLRGRLFSVHRLYYWADRATAIDCLFFLSLLSRLGISFALQGVVTTASATAEEEINRSCRHTQKSTRKCSNGLTNAKLKAIRVRRLYVRLLQIPSLTNRRCLLLLFVLHESSASWKSDEEMVLLLCDYDELCSGLGICI